MGAAMAFIQDNARAFHREAMPTLSVLAKRVDHAHILLTVTGLIANGFASVEDSGAGAGGGGGAIGSASHS